MSNRPTIARHGPAAATHVRGGGSLWRRWSVAAMVEVWGASGGAALEIAEQVGTALVDAVHPAPSRSLTAELRAGMLAADHRVRQLAGDDPLLGVGASVLAWDGRTVLLAQCGPALAFAHRAGGGEPERLPPGSPWLQPEGPSSDDPEAWPALGWPPDRPGEPHVHWTPLACEPGLRVILATTSSAGRLPPEILRALMATPAARGQNGLAAALPPASPALWFGLPEARVGHASRAIEADGERVIPNRIADEADAIAVPGADVPAARAVPTAAPGAGTDGAAARAMPTAEPGAGTDGAAARARAIAEPGAGTGDAAARARAIASQGTAALGTAAGQALAAARPRLRDLAASTVRLGESLLPSRPPEHPREERALAAAAAALILPLAVAAVAVVMQLRLGEGANTLPTPAVPGSLDATLDTSVPGSPPVRRLAGIEVAAPLAGSQTDPRVLVVAPDARYVLNRAQGLVERISADTVTPRLALAIGQEIGGEMVGALEDLAWIPHENGGGRVVALDAAGRLWQIDGSPRLISLSPPPAQLQPARLAGQDGLVYLLDRAGAITRYRLPDADAATATEGGPWLQGVDFAGAADLAIDGSVFVLFEDGRIARFENGSDAGFAVTGLEPPLATSNGLFAGEALGRLLVADAGNGRIVDLSTGGSARARLMTLPVTGAQPGTPLAEGRFADLHAVWWQADEGVLWVVAGAYLLRAPFDPGG